MQKKRTLSAYTMRYVIALGVLTRVGARDEDPNVEINVMFMAAPTTVPRARYDIGRLAEKSGKDIVLLEFSPGNERRGPWNIVVFQHYDDGIAMWEKCKLWSHPLGANLIVSDEGDAWLGFDGVDLVHIAPAPEGQTDEGFALARERLSVAASRVPADFLAGVNGRVRGMRPG